MFAPRLDCPKAGDPIFDLVNENGVNPFWRKPDGDSRIIGNCVWWAGTRFAEVWGFWFKSSNAETFVKQAKERGLLVSDVPVAGSIACWEGVGEKAGHVAFVEFKNSDKSIVTSESGWSAKKAFWTQTRVKGSNGNWGQPSASYRFLGFILPPSGAAAKPSANSSAAASTTVREGDKGEMVKMLQTRLSVLGFLRKSEIDGDFGVITLGAVLAFQHKHGLEKDGIVGPKTWTALKG